MDKFVLVLAAALCFSTSAIAEVTCHTDAFGDVNCTGYDKDGHYVNTTSHKDAFGDVTTTGHIGNSKVNTTAHTDAFGDVNTTGHMRVCNFLWAARSRLIDVGGDSVTK